MVPAPSVVETKFRRHAYCLCFIGFAGISSLVLGSFIRKVMVPSIQASVDQFGNLPDFAFVPGPGTNISEISCVVRTPILTIGETIVQATLHDVPATRLFHPASCATCQENDFEQNYGHAAMILQTGSLDYDSFHQDWLDSDDRDIEMVFSLRANHSATTGKVTLLSIADGWYELWGIESKPGDGWPVTQLSLERTWEGIAFPITKLMYPVDSVSPLGTQYKFNADVLKVIVRARLGAMVPVRLEKHWSLAVFEAVKSGGSYLAVFTSIYGLVFVLKHPQYTVLTMHGSADEVSDIEFDDSLEVSE